MLGKMLIGTRSLIAFGLAIGSIVMIAKWNPEQLGLVITGVISLFSLLLQRKKEDKPNGDNETG